MKTITATITYPVTVSIKVDPKKMDDFDYQEEIKDKLCQLAGQSIQHSLPKPVIHESSDDRLVD